MKRKLKYDDPESRIFIKWLRKNHGRFNNRFTVRRKGTRLHGRYFGIIQEITPVIHENDIEVFIEFHNVSWDILGDFDVILERDRKGRYYCSLCMEDKRELYQSIEELYVSHTYEKFLEWSNEHIKPENFLVFVASKGGSTCARIVTPDDLNKWSSPENLVAILSLHVWKEEENLR